MNNPSFFSQTVFWQQFVESVKMMKFTTPTEIVFHYTINGSKSNRNEIVSLFQNAPPPIKSPINPFKINFLFIDLWFIYYKDLE